MSVTHAPHKQQILNNFTKLAEWMVLIWVPLGGLVEHTLVPDHVEHVLHLVGLVPADGQEGHCDAHLLKK